MDEQTYILNYCKKKIGAMTDAEEAEVIKVIKTTKGIYDLMDILDDPEDELEALDWWWFFNQKKIENIFQLV